ncbi:hypothetical protein A2V82_14725 [candidate division KSB1 bacterium RBG_16_48_16]|nr:MAG: hypothetical protein A2V82_14725 [candidate division KSB1 bacterium RBG_16_48_16]
MDRSPYIHVNTKSFENYRDISVLSQEINSSESTSRGFSPIAPGIDILRKRNFDLVSPGGNGALLNPLIAIII